MKQILFVLALVLILTVCSVGQAFALQYPYGDIRNGGSGESHPWGGDDVINQPPPEPVDPAKYGSTTTYATITQPIDLIFRYFIFDLFDLFEKKQSKPFRTTQIEFRNSATTNDKGIQK